MSDPDCLDELERFMKLRGAVLLHEAVLLTGGRESGEDLLQEALARLIEHRHKVQGNPEAYLRRTLYNLAVDRWRYRARRREVLVAELPERDGYESPGPSFRSQLVDALAKLPRHQRAVLVLRYFGDASEAETAAVLGCSVGKVKSDASRGLSRLRELTQNAGTGETPRTLRESLSD